MIKNILKFGLTLFVFCAAAAGLLAWVYSFTEPMIGADKKKTESAKQREVLTHAEKFETCDDKTGGAKTPDFCRFWDENKAKYPALQSISRGVDNAGGRIGYVVKTAPKGYGDQVVMLVAVDLEGKILKVALVSANGETPGLGARIKSSEEGYLNQFAGKNAGQSALKKDGGEVVPMTGATVTSRAASGGIQQAVQFVQDMLGSGVQ